jgi:cold shock CspA family protein/ribosome-associated translation inhibitor RaiA
MQITATITFRGLEHSPELDADIHARIGKLETFYDSIIGCRVLIELAERHHETGNRFHVRIDLTVPGEEIVVAHDGNLHAAARNLHQSRATKADETDPERKHALVAIREAFDLARRQLQDYVRRQRGAVKAHASPPVGVVTRLFAMDEYGYIEAEDGREVYFHKNSVLHGDFDQLKVGTAVSFVEEAGDKGPQASTVRRIGPHGRRKPAEAGKGEPAVR